MVLFSLSTPNFIEPVAVGAITGMSTRKNPRIMPNVAWISFPMILSILVWYPFQKFKLFEGNGARYGLVAFISTNIALAVFMMPGNVIPWHRYGSDGAVTRWDSIVRFGLVARYLATTPLTAIVTRLTKISTGHHSITSAAAAALLLISLVRVRAGDSAEAGRGDAAATTWWFGGGGPRRRRGYNVEIPWRRVAAAPRLRRGDSVEAVAGNAAATTPGDRIDAEGRETDRP